VIVSEKTFWGADAIGSMGTNQAYYIDQPGYRYFLAGMIALLGGEHRLLQLVNMGVYLAAVIWYLITVRTYPKNLFLPIAVFLVLALPYAANNILEGLSEWLAVTFILFFTTLTLRGNYFLPTLILGLVPFIRQNYLLMAVVLLGLSLIKINNWQTKWIMIGIFSLVILLPLYHNIFYVNDMRFLTTNRGSLINWDNGLNNVIGGLAYVLWWKAKTYVGYWSSADWIRTVQSVLFAPLGTVLLIYFLFRLSAIDRAIFVLMIIFTIGPTVLFGWGYFPRFVFANQAILLSTIPLLLSRHRPILLGKLNNMIH
jgi:hypothetical protein